MSHQSLPKTFTKTIAVLVAITSASDAAVLAQYDFTGSTFASSDTSSATASDLTVGADLAADSATTIDDGTLDHFQVGPQPGNPGEYFTFRYGPLNNTPSLSTNTISFTVTPAAGTTLDLTSLTMDLVNFSGNSGFSAAVYSSLIDGTIDDVNADRLDTFNVSGGSGSWDGYSIDLSGFTGITAETEFRIEFAATGNDGRHAIGVDNLILNGTVIPEPSTALLGALGLLALLRRRRN